MEESASPTQVRPQDNAKFGKMAHVLHQNFYRAWFISERNPMAQQWLQKNDPEWLSNNQESTKMSQIPRPYVRK